MTLEALLLTLVMIGPLFLLSLVNGGWVGVGGIGIKAMPTLKSFGLSLDLAKLVHGKDRTNKKKIYCCVP